MATSKNRALYAEPFLAMDRIVERTIGRARTKKDGRVRRNVMENLPALFRREPSRMLRLLYRDYDLIEQEFEIVFD